MSREELEKQLMEKILAVHVENILQLSDHEAIAADLTYKFFLNRLRIYMKTKNW